MTNFPCVCWNLQNFKQTPAGSIGACLLASFYFASITLRVERKLRPALLAALSLLASLQLLLEISRGVFSYAYPLHDLRLTGILACSVLIGLCLVAISARQFAARWLLVIVLGVSVGLATLMVWVPGMDDKARFALMLASGLSAAIAAYGIWCRQPGAMAYACALALFGGSNLLAQGQFLDTYLFYLIAALLIFLMVQQAGAYASEMQLQREQRARADRLQTALDNQMQADEEPMMSIVSLGKIRRIPVSSIARIQGAGDYAELHLVGGEAILHTIALSALTDELPSYFLRVHRSHIVNTRLVQRLEQAEGGTGTLFLKEGIAVPVSRRIMPGVRKALK